MSENNNSLVIVRGNILLETNAANYEKLLQAAEDIHFDKNNLNQDYEPLRLLREIKKRIDAKENPYKNDWQNWNTARNSIYNPIEKLLERKGKEFTKLADEIKAEKQKVDNENIRINFIKSQIQSISITFSQHIAAATTLQGLVNIEKAIGSEKTRKSTYLEFMPELIDELDKLRPLITTQKENIRQLTAIEKLTKESETSGNDEQLLAAIEKKLEIETSIEQTQSNVQHLALNSAMKTESVESVSETVLPRPKRTYYDYIVTDLEKLKKFHPEFIKTEVDDEKIKEWIKWLRSAGQFKESENNGLKLFIRNTY